MYSLRLLLLALFAFSTTCLAAPAKKITTTTTKKTTTTTTTVKKTATTTTKATTTASSSAGAASCGVNGYSKGTSSYYYDSSGTTATYATCSAKCLADSKCQSFAFGSGACMLFTVSVASNVSPASGSPYIFYDRACVSAASSTTSKTTTASSSQVTTPTSSTSSTTSSVSSTTSPSTSRFSTTLTTLSSSTTTSSSTSTTTAGSSSATTSSSTMSPSATSTPPSTSTVVVPPTSSSNKFVYAHFIAGNAAAMSVTDWEIDITLAKSAHIDGFALNIAAGDSNTNAVLANAYAAAQVVGGFKLFLSFDYLSWGAWSSASVISLVNQYKTSPAQAYYNGKPLVSTFEGTGNTGDWTSIKSATGCFFIPDWSSVGPSGVGSYLNTIDGAFSWDAWPAGANDMTTSSDQPWNNMLGSKAYMMPVSPWFYTNLPNWGKNWLWRGDDMWYQHWQEVISFQPELVEIISWNDYGESHYIGPIRDEGIPSGAWYVNDMPHTGWLAMLPYYIDAYKAGSLGSLAGAPEKISYWYKVNPGLSGSNGGTTGNNPSYQPVVSPELVTQDKVFLDVLVSQPSDVVVTIGSSATTLSATKAGINHFSVPLNGRTGAVTMQIKRSGQVVVGVTGPDITTNCVNGLVNWNAHSGNSA